MDLLNPNSTPENQYSAFTPAYAPMQAQAALQLQQRCSNMVKIDIPRCVPLFDVISKRGFLALQILQNFHSLSEADKSNAQTQLNQLDAALREMLGL